MVESVHKYMKVGLIHPMAYPETLRGEGPILETIRRICMDEYFTAIEITHIADDDVRKKVAKMVDTASMAVGFSAQPMLLTRGLNINDIDEEGRAEAVRVLKGGIDEAYALGARGFAYLSGNYEENNKEAYYEALVKSTLELCDYAKEKGDLKIILEVFDFDVDKKSLIGPVDLAVRFAQDICGQRDNFGMMVDLSHLPLVREDSKTAILPLKEYLVHAHLGNAVVEEGKEAYGDAHPRFGFPNSANDLEEMVEYLRVLKDMGFLNPNNPPIVSFEVKPWGDEDPELVIANAKRMLNQAWARV
ncbi:sugar phosphate isomerase/epimerase family protein [Anaerotalea alkaliphila]|uniref:Sugar phosphate isomerase/epimerase n=1 Tax=Anaerotalea alkaliphila TaxID=2662126 RepID=A0A7X5HY03_9FIRM|nr:TIM barrel protein [Anaerotalea alkaliphila]NDL68742.1 sugar phosphate isomerase/epimerase [Anaerotalea alkaliphila]